LEEISISAKPRRTFEGFLKILDMLDEVSKFNSSEMDVNYPFFGISHSNEIIPNILKST
jgi:hypothetical protein